VSGLLLQNLCMIGERLKFLESCAREGKESKNKGRGKKKKFGRVETKKIWRKKGSI